MPIVDTRDDRKVREAEVFYYSEQMKNANVEQLCNLASEALQVGVSDGSMMEMARFLKRTLEQRFSGQWSVIIGKTFGAYLSVDVRNFVHFRIGRTYFVLHKTNE